MSMDDNIRIRNINYNNVIYDTAIDGGLIICFTK